MDGDWTEFTPAQRAAFTLARKLSFEPHRITDADIDSLRKHYTDLQILEMILSVAGNNSTNRWKEGVGVPQEKEATRFLTNSEQPIPKDRPLPIKSFLTPTPESRQRSISQVAPIQTDKATGRPSHQTTNDRAPLETRAEAEKMLAACQTRTPRLTLVAEPDARQVMGDAWPENAPLPQWVRLLANFPVDGKSRVSSLRAADEKGDLTPLLKAQVSWIIARHDRAWYALGQAKAALRKLGLSDDEIYKLDGDWQDYPQADRVQFNLARNLAASPIMVTDDDVALALKLTGPREVVQLISYTTNRASFDRITEAAGLQLEK